MALLPVRDVGEQLEVCGDGAFSAVAAGTGDNTEVTGNTVNRATFGMPESGIIEVRYKNTLGSSETLALTIKIQESADGSSWDTAETLVSAATVATGTVSAVSDNYKYKVKLSDRKQYVRLLVTPNLSASGTDTSVGAFGFVLGGGRDSGLITAADANDE